VESIAPDAPVAEAAQRLVEARFGCLPVVDGKGDLVGIVSEHDLLKLLTEELRRARPEPLTTPRPPADRRAE
jgi:CBS domain-containing protein